LRTSLDDGLSWQMRTNWTSGNICKLPNEGRGAGVRPHRTAPRGTCFDFGVAARWAWVRAAALPGNPNPDRVACGELRGSGIRPPGDNQIGRCGLSEAGQ
jgi:hypothetical protein